MALLRFSSTFSSSQGRKNVSTSESRMENEMSLRTCGWYNSNKGRYHMREVVLRHQLIRHTSPETIEDLTSFNRIIEIAILIQRPKDRWHKVSKVALEWRFPNLVEMITISKPTCWHSTVPTLNAKMNIGCFQNKLYGIVHGCHGNPDGKVCRA